MALVVAVVVAGWEMVLAGRVELVGVVKLCRTWQMAWLGEMVEMLGPDVVGGRSGCEGKVLGWIAASYTSWSKLHTLNFGQEKY